MSRIGKQPVNIPSGFEVKLDGSKVIIKKGQNTKELDTLGNVALLFGFD